MLRCGHRRLREGTGALGICCIAGLITCFAYQWRMAIPKLVMTRVLAWAHFGAVCGAALRPVRLLTLYAPIACGHAAGLAFAKIKGRDDRCMQ